MKLVLLIFLVIYLFADTQNEVYKEKLIKNRADKQQVKGISKHQRRLYYYANDKEIEKEIKSQKEVVKIASPTIDEKSKARELHIFVNAKKPIIAKRVKELDIASPTIDHRSMIKKIEVNMNLKKEVKIK